MLTIELMSRNMSTYLNIILFCGQSIGAFVQPSMRLPLHGESLCKKIFDILKNNLHLHALVRLGHTNPKSSLSRVVDKARLIIIFPPSDSRHYYGLHLKMHSTVFIQQLLSIALAPMKYNTPYCMLFTFKKQTNNF